MRVCSRCKTEYPDDVTLCPADGTPVRPKGAATAASADPLLGRMVGSYRLTKQLGKGGMGAVYMGEHPAIGSKVAVKFLHPQYAQVQEVVTRFFNEAKAVNLIKHDNIVQVVDYFYLDDEMPCFIMEYLDKGYSMSRLVGRPNPLQIVGPIVMQVCDALQAAHDKQIVHRDLKPDNIFLAVRNYRKHFVKVMDFGIAKLAATGDTSDSNTQMGQVLGTPGYMSPEQASGKVDRIGPASDIYSLGMIMYQLAVGHVAFRGAMGEVIAAHLKDPPTPPRQEQPDIPVAYEAIILRALAKQPEERWGSMREMGQAIAATMRELGLSLELPPDEGDSSGSDFAPSVSLSPYPTRGQAPRAMNPTSGAVSSPPPDESGPTSYPKLAAAPPADSGATSYPNRAPSGPTPASAPRPSSNPDNVASLETLAPVRASLPPTMASPNAVPAPAPAPAPVPPPPVVAAPAAPVATPAPAGGSPMKWVVLGGVVLVLGAGGAYAAGLFSPAPASIPAVAVATPPPPKVGPTPVAAPPPVVAPPVAAAPTPAPTPAPVTPPTPAPTPTPAPAAVVAVTPPPAHDAEPRAPNGRLIVASLGEGSLAVSADKVRKGKKVTVPLMKPDGLVTAHSPDGTFTVDLRYKADSDGLKVSIDCSPMALLTAQGQTATHLSGVTVGTGPTRIDVKGGSAGEFSFILSHLK